jgi:hypothetical protein
MKRFEHRKDLQTSAKIHLKVQFPLQINMLPYTNRARTQDVRENFELARSCAYDLLSVVVHVGKLNSGMHLGKEVRQIANIHRPLYLILQSGKPGRCADLVARSFY